MGETMYDYFLEQPGVLNEILHSGKQQFQQFRKMFMELNPDSLYLIASGSSYNAAQVAGKFMEQMLGIEVRVFPASDLPDFYSPRAFVLFISQGGNSTNTIAAISQIKDYPVMALTGNECCRINEICPHILIGCGEEKAGPKTKGYTGTVLTLQLMALEAALAAGLKCKAEYDEVKQAFFQTISEMDSSICQVQKWYDQNEGTLVQMKKCVVIGKGVGAQAAKEAALKLQETILIPVASYEFEEFLHGPCMAMDSELGGMYLLPPQEDPDYARMAALAKFHRSICPMVYTVGGAADFDGEQDCPAGRDDTWYTRVFTASLPSQIAGALLPEKQGIEGKGLELFWKLDAVLNIKYEGRA